MKKKSPVVDPSSPQADGTKATGGSLSKQEQRNKGAKPQGKKIRRGRPEKPQGKIGRPEIEFNKKDKNKVKHLAAEGLRQDEIAAELGISETTFKDRIKEGEIFSVPYRTGRAERKLKCLMNLHQCSDMAAIDPAYQKSLIWELESQHGMKLPLEVTTPPGQPIQVEQNLSGVAEDKLDKIIAAGEILIKKAGK